ncbi:hypothetical protein FGB62_12g431 [Gracilaria domingensis]|nr:hypothetical protein FGB62_12g431 [Gracilaria domingensis]
MTPNRQRRHQQPSLTPDPRHNPRPRRPQRPYASSHRGVEGAYTGAQDAESICGQTGHNARNCALRSRCRVCNGSGKLKCSKCDGGSALHTRMLAGKRKVERMSRGAVFFDVKQGEEVLVDEYGRIGGKSVAHVRMAKKAWGVIDEDAELGDEEHQVCSRCLGTGFLTCMACSGDD